MKLIKVAAAVLNQTALAWDENCQHIRDAIRAARDQAVQILCLPELCIPGYGCEDAFFSPAVQRTAQEVLLELVPETQGMIVSFGLPLPYRGSVFNAACLAADGRILGFVGKQNLANDGIHYEPRWFRPWPVGQRVDTAIGGQVYPFGDLVFECGGVRIGIRDLRRRLGGGSPGRRPGTQERGHHPESQRQPFRLRKASRPAAFRAGGFPGVQRQLRVCKSAGQ